MTEVANTIASEKPATPVLQRHYRIKEVAELTGHKPGTIYYLMDEGGSVIIIAIESLENRLNRPFIGKHEFASQGIGQHFLSEMSNEGIAFLLDEKRF